MAQAHHLLSAVDSRTPMVITDSTTEEDEAASRALLHVLDGEMELTIVGDDGPETVQVSAGMIVVVPKGRWHRPVAKTMVTLFSATPYTNSDIAFSDDPPT